MTKRRGGAWPVPIAAARLRKREDVLGQLVGRVQYGRERIVLTRHGRPAAALVPMDDHEALERLEDEIDLADALAALREPGRVSWDELKAELKL